MWLIIDKLSELICSGGALLGSNGSLEPIQTDELTLVAAQNLTALAIDECNPAVRIQRHQYGLCSFQVAISPVAFAHRRGDGLLPQRQILEEAHVARRIGRCNMADGKQRGKARAVLTLPPHLAPDADNVRNSGALISLHVRIVLNPILLGHQ